MTEIKVLDKSVFNRIAAGEVVDKPSSIVKELIENSIDAGATSISISVNAGGVEFIRVSDNGKGMSPEDLKTAFLPHATSKINSIDDLDNISTLGFRGEALPSIASVSKVSVLTRRKEAALGCRYVVDNGLEIDFGEMGAPYGTTVTVENLFDRIPARKKFLSKNSIEESAITNLILRYILARYDISFQYTLNGKSIYSSTGKGVESAITTVYGDDYLSKMVKIHSTSSDIVLYGYTNKPSFSKHSKSFQTLIINGRYVVNDDVAYTVFGCYQKYLMTRQYPTYVLYLNLPYDLVDVNVHPSKMQVKFAIPALIKKIVSDAIKEQVIKEVSVPKNIEVQQKNEKERVGQQIRFFQTEESCAIAKKELPVDASVDTPVEHFTPTIEPAVHHQPKATIKSSILGEIEEPISVKIRSKATEQIDKLSEPKEIQPFSKILQNVVEEQDILSIPTTSKIVGKLFNTYVLVENDGSLYIIDQHAAHEKIIYDKYVLEFEKRAIVTQSLLIPYDFTVSPEETEFLKEKIDVFAKCGFEFAHVNTNTFVIKSVPLCCSNLNIKTFIGDFLHDEQSQTDKYSLMPADFKAKLMQSACKAAVKGEDDLSELQINALLSQMRDNLNELFCPHGRPIVIKITKNEIEKWFKRKI